METGPKDFDLSQQTTHCETSPTQTASPRLSALQRSKPRLYRIPWHVLLLLDQPQSVVTEAAKFYNITPYLDGLAKPKVRQDGPFRDAEWKVSEGAKQCTPTERLEELARPKKPAEGYQPCRDTVWKVGVGALNAVASNR